MRLDSRFGEGKLGFTLTTKDHVKRGEIQRECFECSLRKLLAKEAQVVLWRIGGGGEGAQLKYEVRKGKKKKKKKKKLVGDV